MNMKAYSKKHLIFVFNLFDGISSQNAENIVVANFLSLTLKNLFKGLFSIGYVNPLNIYDTIFDIKTINRIYVG